jgi:uncharacterized protein YceH (UPF0502 family)
MSINDLIADGETAALSEMEARVLGSLMEKQLTTPDTYPLTLNSLVIACNQKTSREPVTNYNQGEVQACLSRLQDRKLVDVDYGARAQRYDQRLTWILGVNKSVQALLTILLLRGPQTAGELYTRTQRMADFASVDDVEEQLQHLCAKTAPLIVQLPRLPGQREERYMHLLCGAPDVEALASQISQRKSASGDLEERVAQLEQQVHSLQEELAALKSRSNF